MAPGAFKRGGGVIVNLPGSAGGSGLARQYVNVIGFAPTVNSVALHGHRRRREQSTAA